MNRVQFSNSLVQSFPSMRQATRCFISLIAGLLMPLAFAPFHLPGFAILGIAILFTLLQQETVKTSFYLGFFFGLGYLGFGVSWVYVSIHDYGHITAIGSVLITLLFIVYLALYFALMMVVYQTMANHRSLLASCLIFSALWCLTEYLRAWGTAGFPWLLLGFSQIDTPLKYVMPVIGVYGVGFLACLAATFLAIGLGHQSIRRHFWVLAFITVLMTPLLLKNKEWSTLHQKPVSVGVIQANLSMRDKWDESFFWNLLHYYHHAINRLTGKVKLIVMPESAIPLPASYISEIIDDLHTKAKSLKSGILLGMLQASDHDENQYHNAMVALGTAKGSYLKQQLVPFGEFIPVLFKTIIDWLGIPVANIVPGKAPQDLITIGRHPIASLICYELAYPSILRQQMPKAQWIVSISDDGWFGHSLAMYQQLQMAQTLSVLTARYQIVANNDGLSSIINSKGVVVASLPAMRSGTLTADIYPASGTSPWIQWGDAPIVFLCLLLLFAFSIHRHLTPNEANSPIAAKHKRRYPYQPN